MCHDFAEHDVQIDNDGTKMFLARLFAAEEVYQQDDLSDSYATSFSEEMTGQYIPHSCS